NKENDSSSGGQNPWGGQRPSSGSGDDLPEMEEILRQAHESLGGFFSNGGRGGSRRTAPPVMGSGTRFTLLLAAVLVLWAATGLYRVLPEENAIILTFGKWTATRGEPGLGYHLPWPVQEVLKVNVAFDRRIEI